MSTRKYIRIALNETDKINLTFAKKQLEDQTGIAMTDSMFVLSLVRKSITK